MIGGAIIGKYHAADLQYINDPISQYYIPYPDAIADCDTLKTNDAALTAQITFWNVTLNSETNGTAINNITQIIQIQTDKQAQYKTKIVTACAVAPPTTGGTTTTASGNNSMIWIIAAAAGALVLFGGKIFGNKKQAKQ
jgi:hypothetical protein